MKVEAVLFIESGTQSVQALCAERASLIQNASFSFDYGGELSDAEVSERN